MSVTVTIPIPLGRPIGQSERAVRRMLTEIGRECDRIRNACLWRWQEWARSCGEIKKPIPNAATCNLYAHGCAIAPQVLTTITSSCSSEVSAWLRGRMPWQDRELANRRWQALLQYDISCPSFRSREIPLHNCLLKKLRRTDAGYELDVVLYSPRSGRKNRGLRCELDVKDLSPGHRRHLDAAIFGDAKVRDSSIQLLSTAKGRSRRSSRKSGWRLLLVLGYEDSAGSEHVDRACTIKLADPKAGRPFVVVTPEEKEYRCGAGAALVYQFTRLRQREVALRAREQTGHGRGRMLRAVKPIARARHGLLRAFRASLVRDVIGICEKERCGTLLIVEPTLGERQKDWFSEHGLTNDWTRLIDTLVNSAVKAGLSPEVIGRKKKKAKHEKTDSTLRSVRRNRRREPQQI